MRATKIFGCTLLGCLGFPVAVALLLGVVVVLGKASERPSDPEFESVEQAIPAAEPTGTRGGALPLEASPGEGQILPARAAGVLRLDISAAEVRVDPIPAGESLRVEADYDRGAFELEKRMQEGPDGWEYTIEFRPRSWLGSFSRENVDNRIKIGIPEDVPLRIEGRVRLAENDMELGGLHLLSLDLETGVGEHAIGFGRPTVRPVESIKLDGGVGQLDLYGLGNASPLSMRVSQSIGELHLDLEGAWRNDSEIVVDMGVGELDVERPLTARVETRKGGLSIGESSIARDREQEGDDTLPLVVLRTKGTIGEIRVD